MRKHRKIPKATLAGEGLAALISALRHDLRRQHESQLAELVGIKTALKDLQTAVGLFESSNQKVPPNDSRESGFALSCYDETMPVPEILPTLLHVGEPPARDPMKGERQSRVGKLYVENLKKVGILRFFWDSIGRKIYLFFKSMLRKTISSLRPGGRHYPIVTLSDHAGRSPQGRMSYAAEETVEAPRPPVFPEQDRDYLNESMGCYVFPEIYITTINNAVVSGGTNMILTGENVLCHDLYDFSRDSTSEELHGRAAIYPDAMHVRWLTNSEESEVLPVAAAFVDACAHNYAHWMTEVLPRICLFCADERYRDVPIIVNEGLHRNLVMSLFTVVGSERTIILLPIGKALRVERLLSVSPTGYVPFDRRSNMIEGHRQGQFSPYAMNFLRSSIMANLQLPKAPLPKRIYIKRTSGTRVLLNADAIEKMLIDRGFVCVEPEKLNFSEQVNLFSQADIIVGATGAAFANSIFCKKASKIVVMIAKHENMPYWYWQNMAHSVGCQVTYVLGKIIRKTELGIHGDFLVDPKSVLRAIEPTV
jgi:capsular polysaccharide biosynthesis protein